MTDSSTIRAAIAQGILDLMAGVSMGDACHIMSDVLGMTAGGPMHAHGHDVEDAEDMIEAIATDAKAHARAYCGKLQSAGSGRVN